MTTFRFADPLWLLLLLPLLLVLFLPRWRSPAVLYSSVSLLEGLPITAAQRIKRLLPLCKYLGLAGLVIGLARPQKGKEEFRVRTEGIAIMMAIDKSGSMEALDFELDGERVNRLEVVKDVFRRFVAGDEEEELPGRPDDWIGLVAFGGFAHGLCPLTLDHGALLTLLDQVEIPQPKRDRQGHVLDEKFALEDRATAIGDAIALGTERLRDATAKSRVLILLSDGEQTAGLIQPLDAARTARELGVRVYTIGVGTNDPVPVPFLDAFGRRQLRQQIFRLDEATLKAIAEETGGQYFSARSADSLAEIYAQIDELERTEAETLLYTEYRELYRAVLLPGAVLLLLHLLLTATRFSTLP
jgi:Ca-activated chloride channel family protein